MFGLSNSQVVNKQQTALLTNCMIKEEHKKKVQQKLSDARKKSPLAAPRAVRRPDATPHKKSGRAIEAA